MVTCFKNSLFNTNTGNCNSNVFKGSNAVIFFIFNLILLLTVGCKQEYNQPVKATETNYLVVEGFINAAGSTKITLSRTTGLKDSVKIKSEQGATVMIQGEDNSSIPLSEDTIGHYQSDSIILNKNQKYRLYIKTINGKEYLSDNLAVKKTPVIDSVSWRNENNGVNIYVNSHDEPNNSRYYKWTYEQTWEIHSYRHVLKDYVNGDVSARNLDEINKLFYCWHYENSSSIILGSTARLSDNVISMIPVVNISRYEEQLSVRYSIVVKQIALDKQAYEFYGIMKKNTETTGSLFGSLPTELSTNIHCLSNTAEKVIGYVTISTEEKSKRIFISNAEVPAWNYQSGCGGIFIENNSSAMGYFADNVLIPYGKETSGMNLLGFYASTRWCMDCRIRGTNVKPSFW